MVELRTLARPYAKAAYQYARGANALDHWSKMLGELAAVVAHDKVKRLLASPSITSIAKAEQLNALCGDVLDDKGANFVSMLATNHRLALIPFIQQQFEVLKAAHEKTVDVEVVTATELEQAQIDGLVVALTARSQCEVSISPIVDHSLLGGAIIRIGDTVIDGSIKGRLTQLSRVLNS